jgi:two-component system sensor histidine kinase DesK
MAERSAEFVRSDGIPRPRLARRILLVVVLCYTVNGLINFVIDHQGTRNEAASVVCILGVFGIQLLHLSRRALDWPPGFKAATLSAQSVLTILPVVAFGQNWGGMGGFLGGSFLLLLPARMAWPLVIALELGSGAVAEHYSHSSSTISYYVIATLVTTLVIFGMTRLSHLVGELHAMRAEMARMAVAQERLRFARDLHDLLGYSLSSITLKSELTYRLVSKQPLRAQEEVAGILEISRQALADVRAVASSYRNMSLVREAAAAEAMLNEAEIDTSVQILCGALPPALDTVLATTLREGVTNALRHSKVQRCRISATQVDDMIVLELANDGVVRKAGAVPARRGGSGLENLAARVAAFNGTLTAGVADDGWFRLAVRVPRACGVAGRAVPVAPDGSMDRHGGGTGEHRDHDPVG